MHTVAKEYKLRKGLRLETYKKENWSYVMKYQVCYTESFNYRKQ